jgi:prepilin-type N-terminal cleavage/methylation domain-containing protein
MRLKRHHGFTLTEMMATLAIVTVLAVLAVPRLGRSRQGQDTIKFARMITRTLETARVRAVTLGRYYRVTITPALLTTMYSTDKGSSWTQEAALPAPSEAQVWDVVATLTAPTTVMSSTHYLQFKPDFTFTMDPSGAAAVNSNIYVASRTSPLPGQRYVVSVVGTGAVRFWDQW